METAWRWPLGVKLVLSLVISLAVVEVGYSIVEYRNHRRALEESVHFSAERLGNVVKRGLWDSMLENRRDQLLRNIRSIGAEPGIEKIRIFDPLGTIEYSSDAPEVGHMVDKEEEACYACHSQAEPLHSLDRPDRMRTFVGETGTRSLGLIIPIENAAECYTAACHVHAPEQKVLGVIDMVLSLGNVDQQLRTSRNWYAVVIVSSLLLITGIAIVFVWFFVTRPVHRLTEATRRVAAGELIPIGRGYSADEIGALALSFDRMTMDLAEARQELTAWGQELEQRVQRKREQLRQADARAMAAAQMATIGKLAASVAHEINNPLAGIRTYARLLLRRLSVGDGLPADDPGAHEALMLIESESARCGEIVKHLLQYSRPGKTDMVQTDVNQVVREAARLIQHQTEVQNLDFRVELSDSLPQIVCHPHEVKQMLLVLLINACEASHEEGRLWLRTKTVPDSLGVRLEVEDEGEGIPYDVQERVFEPFFTTRESGKGVGLGLAIAQGIARRHGGTVAMESVPGQGAHFTIDLPDRPPEDEAKGDEDGA